MLRAVSCVLCAKAGESELEREKIRAHESEPFGAWVSARLLPMSIAAHTLILSARQCLPEWPRQARVAVYVIDLLLLCRTTP